VVFGVGVGMLVGLTGVGGGSLMTPLLILVFGVKPITAVGTDLAYAAVTKSVGGYKHWRQRTVEVRLSGWMALGSVPAAVCGVQLLDLLERVYGDRFDRFVLTLLGAALLITGAATLGRALFLRKLTSREREKLALRPRDKLAAIALGCFVGLVLGVTSAGSGALIAVGLILVFQLVPQRVVGTDVFHAAVLLWAAAIAHLAAGNVDYALAGTILLGSVPGVWVGSHLSVRVPASTLRTALGVVLVGSGLAVLSRAGARIPDAALASVPLATVVLVAARLVARRRGSDHRTLSREERAVPGAAGRAGTPP
jgi:uncharacterized membrane protein YfcA